MKQPYDNHSPPKTSGPHQTFLCYACHKSSSIVGSRQRKNPVTRRIQRYCPQCFTKQKGD